MRNLVKYTVRGETDAELLHKENCYYTQFDDSFNVDTDICCGRCQ